MVESFLLVSEVVGSNPGRALFYLFTAYYFFPIYCKFNLLPNLYFLLNNFLKISKDDKSKDFMPIVTYRLWVRILLETDISDSMNDFVLTNFFSVHCSIL